MTSSFGEIERQLQSISHSEEAIQAVQAFSNGLAGTKRRLEVWNAVNAIVRKPIDYGETSALGFDTPDDPVSYRPANRQPRTLGSPRREWISHQTVCAGEQLRA
jgi:hypothetical protein